MLSTEPRSDLIRREIMREIERKQAEIEQPGVSSLSVLIHFSGTSYTVTSRVETRRVGGKKER